MQGFYMVVEHLSTGPGGAPAQPNWNPPTLNCEEGSKSFIYAEQQATKKQKPS